MNTRQEKILAAVIKEYTQAAVPVGSKILVERYGFEISPATIRNDMIRLEKEGYIYQPHISAGRIPTDKGYRYFVEEIMKEEKLTESQQKKLQSEVLKLKAQNKRLSRTAAKLLASFSGTLAISGTEKEFSDFGMSGLLENPEFQEIDEFCKVAEALDCIDESVGSILKKVKEGETKIFIGRESPIKEISSCSMLVTPYKNRSGEKGILAIIGPKRMEYAKNKSILDYLRKLLGSGV